jgi:hypothetical protein
MSCQRTAVPSLTATPILGSVCGATERGPGGEPNAVALQRDPAGAQATPRSRRRLVALSATACRLATAVANWSLGDVIPLGHRALRVIGKRDDDADQAPVLVVEDVAG